MEYTLKDKIQITKEFLADLETKSWQEIEHLQSQIANIEPIESNARVIQLLKNLLTSYYVFTGGLENLNSGEATVVVPKQIKEPNLEKEVAIPEPEVYDIDTFEPISLPKEIEQEITDPFEYFVDFDDPVGEPLTDDDLYT
jgi:hypothetical protein